MARVRQRFKRVAEAFGELARVTSCESSGSDQSAAESLNNLSDLVRSFIENEGREATGDRDAFDRENVGNKAGSECRRNEYYETKACLKSVLASYNDLGTKASIFAAAKKAVVEVQKCLPVDFNRCFMTRLRSWGFDAGICKSKWEKTAHAPAGNYEYIDVLMDGNRYMVEVTLAKEFEIARPTACYAEILNHFPPIFVGKADELKEIVKLMCKSMKKSMKTMEMHVPPWRRLAYVQAKWFGSYKRTTTESAAVQKGSNSDLDMGRKRSIGFPPLPYLCRERLAINGKGGFDIGNLAEAL